MGGERCCYGISYYCPASLGLSTVTIQNVDIWYYPQALLVSPIDWHVLALISVAGRKVPHTDLTHLGFLFSRRGDGRH